MQVVSCDQDSGPGSVLLASPVRSCRRACAPTAAGLLRPLSHSAGGLLVPLMRKLAAHRRSLPDSGFLLVCFHPPFFSSFCVSLLPSFCLCHRPISIRRLQADQVLRSGRDKQIAAATKKVYVEPNWTGSFFGGCSGCSFWRPIEHENEIQESDVCSMRRELASCLFLRFFCL